MKKVLTFLLLLASSRAFSNKYYLIFFADKSANNVGHGFVSFIKVDDSVKQTILEGSWGFYPLSSSPIEVISHAITFIPGTVQPDFTRIKSEGFTIEVSHSEYEACLKTKDDWLHKPYSVTRNNCKDFIYAIAENIENPKFKQPNSLYRYPAGYIDDLKKLNTELEVKGPLMIDNIDRKESSSIGASVFLNKVPVDDQMRNTFYHVFHGLEKVSENDKATILTYTKVKYSDSSYEYYSADNSSIKYLGIANYVTDLNNDGIKEIMIDIKGRNKLDDKSFFFVKSDSLSLYYPALYSSNQTTPLILLEKNSGYNNLYVEDKETGKVFKWDGSKYVLSKKIDKKIIWESRNGMSFDVAKNYFSNVERFPKMIWKNPLNDIEELKDLSGRNVNAKIGDPSKFLGGWWQIGYYKYPIFIRRFGNQYKIGDNNFTQAKVLSYNSKTDRLEGWVLGKGIKLKVIVLYDYSGDNITIRPETSGLGIWPLNLMRYSF